MAGYKISICNYKFTAHWRTPKGQKREKSFEKIRCPLIGEDEQEIREDPTGHNQKQMRKDYSRFEKHPKNINQTRFTLDAVEVLQHYGTTQWIKKP